MDPFPASEAVANARALVLQAHRRWLNNEPGGVRLDLRGANMIGAFMRGAYMGDANLAGAYMRDANMTGAFMAGAFMGGANLNGAFMRGAYMGGANMRDACMTDAILPNGIVRRIAPAAEPEAG